MRIRKGQRVIKLKIPVDQVDEVVFNRERWASSEYPKVLCAIRPENIATGNRRKGVPEGYWFFIDTIILDRKSNSTADIEVTGRKFVRQ